jgi:hypothetical protein
MWPGFESQQKGGFLFVTAMRRSFLDTPSLLRTADSFFGYVAAKTRT